MKNIAVVLLLVFFCSFCGCSKQVNESQNITEIDNEFSKTKENTPFSIRKSLSYVLTKTNIEKMYGKADISRELPDYFYEIRNKDDGSKVFYFYSNSNINFIWRLKKLFVKNDFDNIKVDISDTEDVRDIDPYFSFIQGTDNTAISEHLLINNEVAIIDYYLKDKNWLVKGIRFELDTFQFSNKLLEEDLEKIRGKNYEAVNQINENTDTSQVTDKDENTISESTSTETPKLRVIRQCDIDLAIEKGDLTLEEAIDTLINMLFEELSKEDIERDFIITDVKNYDVCIIDRESEYGTAIYKKFDDNVNVIEGTADILFEGIYSPIGPSDYFPKDHYFSISLDNLYIIISEDEYHLVTGRVLFGLDAM